MIVALSKSLKGRGGDYGTIIVESRPLQDSPKGSLLGNAGFDDLGFSSGKLSNSLAMCPVSQPPSLE